MGEEEIPIGEQPRRSLAAPLIFFIVVAFQFVSIYLHQLKKKGSKSAAEIQLRAEIKQLLKDANALSQPSTFAQAAKLRRLAAAKEKELANYKEAHDKEMKLSSDSYRRFYLFQRLLRTLCSFAGFGGLLLLKYLSNLCSPLEGFYLGGLEVV